MTTRPNARYVSLLELSDRTGLSVRWLRAELDAGRLPALKMNRRRMIPLAEAETRLAARAVAAMEGGVDAK